MGISHPVASKSNRRGLLFQPAGPTPLAPCQIPCNAAHELPSAQLAWGAKLALLVTTSLPVKTVPELIAYAKANPDRLSFGSPGVGSSVHISGELFKSMAGVTMTHVPYKGRQFAIPDLVGGSIQLMFDNMPSALPMAREGKIRPIAQTGARRSPSAPDIPTVAESGLPGFEATSWFALFAPAGTPREVVARLHTEVQRVFRLPDVQERLRQLGLDPLLGGPEDLARFQQAEIAKWARVVKESGAQAQ